MLLLIPSVIAECVDVQNGKTYPSSREFCGITYFLPDGITITGKDIAINCNTATMRGTFSNAGITIINSENVTIENCNILHYEIGILVVNSTQVGVKDTGLVRNNIGIKLIDSNQNYFAHINDISLHEMVQVVNSIENAFEYTNKKLENDFCRFNKCNKKAKPAPQNLQDILRLAIRNWLAI